MEKKISATTWGAALIGLGILFLLNQFFPAIGGFIWGLVWAGGFAMLGLWFFSMYRREKHNIGLLIPAYVFFAISGVILLSTLLPEGHFTGMLIPAYVMGAIAAPFLYVYTRDTKNNWWALIPGGIMGMIALGFLTAAMWQILPVVLIVVGVYILVRNLGAGSQRERTAPNGHRGEPVSRTPVEFEPLRPPKPEDK